MCAEARTQLTQEEGPGEDRRFSYLHRTNVPTWDRWPSLPSRLRREARVKGRAKCCYFAGLNKRDRSAPSAAAAGMDYEAGESSRKTDGEKEGATTRTTAEQRERTRDRISGTRSQDSQVSLRHQLREQWNGVPTSLSFIPFSSFWAAAYFPV